LTNSNKPCDQISEVKWEYQFFVDLVASEAERLDAAARDLRSVAQEVKVLGIYAAVGR
jgi:prephenate dehydratase